MACLTYIGSLFNVGLFLLCLAALARRRCLPLLLVAAAALGLTVALLYVPFAVVFVSEILPQMARAASGAVAPGTGLLAGLRDAVARVPLFWGWAMPVMALVGLRLTRRRMDPAAWSVLRAYLLAFLVLLMLRGLAPALFKDVKETTFVAPLMALLAGWLLEHLAGRGRRQWAAAVLVAGGLAVLGVARGATYFTTYRSAVVASALELPASPLTEVSSRTPVD
jgi:hypothetical protein